MRLGDSERLKFGGKISSFSSCETQTHPVDELNSNMSSEIMLTQLKLICMVLSWIHSFIEEKQVSCLLYIRLCQKWGLQLWERQSWLPKANNSKGRPALHNSLGSHPVLEHSCLPVLEHTSLIAALKPWYLSALLEKHLPQKTRELSPSLCSNVCSASSQGGFFCDHHILQWPPPFTLIWPQYSDHCLI